MLRLTKQHISKLDYHVSPLTVSLLDYNKMYVYTQYTYVYCMYCTYTYTKMYVYTCISTKSNKKFRFVGLHIFLTSHQHLKHNKRLILFAFELHVYSFCAVNRKTFLQTTLSGMSVLIINKFLFLIINQKHEPVTFILNCILKRSCLLSLL